MRKRNVVKIFCKVKQFHSTYLILVINYESFILPSRLRYPKKIRFYNIIIICHTVTIKYFLIPAVSIKCGHFSRIEKLVRIK